MISIKNVSYAIHEQPTLHAITLEVPRGGITALIGPNGAGKSTLLSLIARFSLEPFANRLLDEISDGQRQRALGAMAYAQSTDYLLLDEPLNNLGIAAGRQLMQALRMMAHEGGKSIVIVLHDINYTAAFADRVVVMSQGRVATVGTPTDIITQKNLSQYFNTDAEVLTANDRRRNRGPQPRDDSRGLYRQVRSHQQRRCGNCPKDHCPRHQRKPDGGHHRRRAG